MLSWWVGPMTLCVDCVCVCVSAFPSRLSIMMKFATARGASLGGETKDSPNGAVTRVRVDHNTAALDG